MEYKIMYSTQWDTFIFSGARDPYGPPRPDFNSYLTEDNLMNNVESLVDNELEDKMDSAIDQ